MGKLNIDTQPERFSRVERAIHFNNMIAAEIKADSWNVDLPITKDSQFLGVPILFTGEYDGAFLEGFFAAVAFCSGAVSRGKVMDVCSKTWLPDVLHQALNTAKAAMEKQTLWEQNQEPSPSPLDGAKC